MPIIESTDHIRKNGRDLVTRITAIKTPVEIQNI